MDLFIAGTVIWLLDQSRVAVFHAASSRLGLHEKKNRTCPTLGRGKGSSS